MIQTRMIQTRRIGSGGPAPQLHILNYYLQSRLGLQTLLRELLADPDLLDDRFVALGVVGFEVVEQAATPTDHHEKAAARAVVLLVQFEVFRQLANPLAEQRDLDFRAAGIGSMRSVLSDEILLMFGG
jgi:hypothetical protein